MGRIYILEKALIIVNICLRICSLTHSVTAVPYKHNPIITLSMAVHSVVSYDVFRNVSVAAEHCHKILLFSLHKALLGPLPLSLCLTSAWLVLYLLEDHEVLAKASFPDLLTSINLTKQFCLPKWIQKPSARQQKKSLFGR